MKLNKVKSKKTYCQPYSNKKHISSWYYKKVPKGIFKYDQIRVQILSKEENDLWMTPDEAIDIIRAISAALHHWLIKSNETKKIIDEKTKT